MPDSIETHSNNYCLFMYQAWVACVLSKVSKMAQSYFNLLSNFNVNIERFLINSSMLL